MELINKKIILMVIILSIIRYGYKMKTDINPLTNYGIAYYLYCKIIKIVLSNNLANEMSNKYIFYTIRTTQKLDNINEQIPITIKPSILCIQCDNRKGVPYIDNSNKINSLASKYHKFKHNFVYKNKHGMNNGALDKIKFVQQKLIDTDCEYVMWIDSDAYICPSFNINLIINNYPNASFLVSRDPVRNSKLKILNKINYFPVFCCGIFIVKNNSKGKEIIDFIIDHLTNPKKIKMYEKIDPEKVWAGFYHDQGIMNVAIRKFRKHCTLLHYKYLNDSPNNLNEKSWIIHAMGENSNKRNEISSMVMKIWDKQM